MRYFLDAEFNGFGGELISIALVPEDQSTAFYAAVHCDAPTQWVCDHVLPVLNTDPLPRCEVTTRLAAYLDGASQPIVVANWPEDLAHLLLLLVTGPGARAPTPKIVLKLLDLPMFDSKVLSRTPHNALSDASALKTYVLREERPI